MKKYILIATLLFIFHTAEEAFTQFWKINSFLLTKIFGFEPMVSYWIAQPILYVFSFVTYRCLHTKHEKKTLFILGLILLYEFWHPLASLRAGTYTSGLLTGTLISIFSIYYWTKLYRYLKSGRQRFQHQKKTPFWRLCYHFLLFQIYLERISRS